MRDADKALKGYLQMVAKAAESGDCNKPFRFKSYEAFYLKKGFLFSCEPYTEKEKKRVLELFGRLRVFWPISQCWSNAQQLAERTDDLGIEYAEGYCMGHVIPVHHGWLAIGKKPIDITLREDAKERICAPKKLLARAEGNLKTWAYWGATFPMNFIHKVQLKHREYMSVLGSRIGQEKYLRPKKLMMV